MLGSENRKTFIDEWLASWTGNQPEKLMTYYAEDAYYQDPARPQGLRGHGEMLPYFRKLLAVNPNWVWRAVELIPTSKGFTLKWKATIPVGDRTVEEHGLDIVEIDNDLITRNEVYFDRANLMAAAQSPK
ncbi:nuclear transport factor 2 family protein [bacterium]|nr:nuclear transport factor 2 family protein [bacterium]